MGCCYSCCTSRVYKQEQEEKEHKPNSKLLGDNEIPTMNSTELEVTSKDKITLDSIDNNYFPKFGYTTAQQRLDPIARILLIGVYDDNNVLSIFRGMRYLIKSIWDYTLQFNQHHYSNHIQIGQDPFHYNENPRSHKPVTAFSAVVIRIPCSRHGLQYHPLSFPPPLKKDVNINMMPIKFCESIDLEDQIPNELHGYIPYITACLRHDDSLRKSICYLTIHESFVNKGNTQRRPGLHVEKPGNNTKIQVNGAWITWHSWGWGAYLKDGIYIASNISDTCAVWNVLIMDNEQHHDYKQMIENSHRDQYCRDRKDKEIEIASSNDVGVIGNNGDIEHLRSILPSEKRYYLEKNKLYWMTDRTPHEALPMKEDGWRQFFRLVSGKLSVWYETHSTKNPMGIVPDPKITTIIKESKFDSVNT